MLVYYSVHLTPDGSICKWLNGCFPSAESFTSHWVLGQLTENPVSEMGRWVNRSNWRNGLLNE